MSIPHRQSEKQACELNYYYFFSFCKRLRLYPSHLPHACSVADTTSPGSSLGAPWVCVSRPEESEPGVTPTPGPVSAPCVSITQSPPATSLQADAVDSGDGDYDVDDGPEYLAIGNLGQRSRCDSRSSTLSSEQDVTQDQSVPQCSLARPPPRRSSFSEGQRGPGRGSRGHTRSFSDTGVNQKLRNGKSALRDLI